MPGEAVFSTRTMKRLWMWKVAACTFAVTTAAAMAARPRPAAVMRDVPVCPAPANAGEIAALSELARSASDEVACAAIRALAPLPAAEDVVRELATNGRPRVRVAALVALPA